jgi:hypothetical protein
MQILSYQIIKISHVLMTCRTFLHNSSSLSIYIIKKEYTFMEGLNYGF